MPKPTAFAEAMERALAGRESRILDTCTSTNDEARTWARAGAPHLGVVVADSQEAGRGRRGRAWIAEPGAALLCSVVLRPSLEPARWGLIPLLAGVAAFRTVGLRTGVSALLKWPNDLVVGDRKLGGILCEAEPSGFVVCGLGLNVSAAPAGVGATSLAEEGSVRLDRADLAASFVGNLDLALADPTETLRTYVEACATIGQVVRVTKADGTWIHGAAIRVDDSGALLVRTDDATVRVDAGDVEHVRRG